MTPQKTQKMHNICTTSAERLWRWSKIVQIVASELKDPICHSNECQIGSFSSEATKCYANILCLLHGTCFIIRYEIKFYVILLCATYINQKCGIHTLLHFYTAVQSHNVASAYFTSMQILHFGFAEQNRYIWTCSKALNQMLKKLVIWSPCMVISQPPMSKCTCRRVGAYTTLLIPCYIWKKVKIGGISK